MGQTYLDNKYTINGLVDTGQAVLNNLQTLCNSCGTWLTYDVHQGQWAVTINQAGTSTFSFNDHNVIGAVTISGTGVDSLYTGVRVSYPRDDINNKTDWIEIDIPQSDWYPNESTNVMSITYPLVTDPVQAELLGFMELKQSRVDKVIKFTADYTAINVKAGDIIDVTNSVYGFTNKLFRVITVAETDDTAGNIALNFTALEYDASIYDTSNLSRYTVTNANGILPIGAIPAPQNFTVTKYENDPRPRVDFAATVSTGGLVEGVEFWTTTDTTQVVDSARYYQLAGVARPASGNTFTAGSTVGYSVDSLVAGNFYAKARSVNSQGVSPFTDVTGFVYTPVQTTQAISDNTNSGGLGGLGGELGMLALMSLLNGLFSGNSTSSLGGLTSGIKSLFDKAKATGDTATYYIQPDDPAANVSVADGSIWYETDA